MAIISGKHAIQRSKIKVEINADVYTEMQAYCAWANLPDLSAFIEESACFIFSKDKEWKAHKKVAKRAIKKKTTTITD